MQLVILAGGKGTRLGDLGAGLPKPMIDIGGKPLLEHQVELARQHGIRDILLLTGYRGDDIVRYFGDGSRFGVKIRYRRDTRPRGTAGAVLHVFEELEKIFMVMYGDAMLKLDLSRLEAAHRPDADATLTLR